jgi:spermidine/putrescine transport system permease protein
MVSGFTPQIPALGVLSVAGSTVLVLAGLILVRWLRRRT